MNKKIGIVLSGGGARGAFIVGVLKVLLEKIKNDGDVLHAVGGTSIGAMIGSFVAADQFADLERIWLSWDRKNCPLIQTDLLGPLTILYRGYIYHSEPLKDFLKNNLKVSNLLNSSVKYVNNSTRAYDNELRLGGNTYGNKDEDLAIKEIMASMAFIPWTPSVNINGDEYIDGGFKNIIPVKLLIENSEKLDRIYIIKIMPEKIKQKDELLKNNIFGLLPKIEYLFFDWMSCWPEICKNNVEIGSLTFGNPNEYIVVNPIFTNLGIGDFDKNLIKEAYEHGIEVAAKIQ